MVTSPPPERITVDVALVAGDALATSGATRWVNLAQRAKSMMRGLFPTQRVTLTFAENTGSTRLGRTYRHWKRITVRANDDADAESERVIRRSRY